VPSFSLTTEASLLASPDVVWGQLVDRDSVADWFEGLESLSGSTESFSTRRATEGPCSCPLEGSVDALEPERHLAVTFRAPWRLLRSIALDVTLHPEDAGTRVQILAAYELRGVGLLLRPLVRLRAEVALYRAVRAFRAAAEDETARRRRAPRAGQQGFAPSRAAAPAPSHDALLLRTAS